MPKHTLDSREDAHIHKKAKTDLDSKRELCNEFYEFVLADVVENDYEDEILVRDPDDIADFREFNSLCHTVEDSKLTYDFHNARFGFLDFTDMAEDGYYRIESVSSFVSAPLLAFSYYDDENDTFFGLEEEGYSRVYFDSTPSQKFPGRYLINIILQQDEEESDDSDESDDDSNVPTESG
jgi:hypothetical protein